MHGVEVFQLYGHDLFQIGFGVSSVHDFSIEVGVCYFIETIFYQITILFDLIKYNFDYMLNILD